MPKQPGENLSDMPDTDKVMRESAPSDAVIYDGAESARGIDRTNLDSARALFNATREFENDHPFVPVDTLENK
jgi:hypothetical protein